jgi:hypothetical protein
LLLLLLLLLLLANGKWNEWNEWYEWNEWMEWPPKQVQENNGSIYQQWLNMESITKNWGPSENAVLRVIELLWSMDNPDHLLAPKYET